MATMVDFGHADSLVCRWCNRAKTLLRGARLCDKCDGPDIKDAKATWQVTAP